VSFPRTNNKPLDSAILSDLYNTYMSIRVLKTHNVKTKSKFFQNNLNIVQGELIKINSILAFRNRYIDSSLFRKRYIFQNKQIIYFTTGHDEYVKKHFRYPKTTVLSHYLLHKIPLVYFCMQSAYVTSLKVES